MTPAQRQLNDQKYQSMQELYEAMPQEARDTQFAIYEARNTVDAKRSPRALKRLKLSFWKENNFTDTNTLKVWLEDKYGPGRYLIEPEDEHGHRILKFPFWCISTDQFDEEDMDDEYEDEYPRRRRRRVRERDYDDEDFDDPSDRRSIADGLLMAQRASSVGIGQAMNQSKDMMSLMLLTNQENSKIAREDALRREEMRAKEESENRRRDQEKRDAEEKRRYDDDKRREDDRIRREDQIRQENQRREDAQREADRKHERDLAEARAASDRKFQAILAALPVIIPVAEKFLKPAQLPAPATDPLSMMMAKSFLEDKRDRDPNAAVQVIVEATKLGAQLQTEQMRSAMSMQGELNKILMAKTMEQMNGGGKNMLETITELVTGAAGIAEKLLPAKPAPNPYVERAAARIPQQQRPVEQSAPVARQPAQPQQPVAPEQQPVPENRPGEPAELTPEQEHAAYLALQATVEKVPIYGTLRALYGIHNRYYSSQGEYQKLIEYSVRCMPLDLRVAILDNNEERVMELVGPVLTIDPAINEWAHTLPAITWLRSFIPQLIPTIEAVHGAAEQQREQYVALLAQATQIVQERQAEAAKQAEAAPQAEATEPAHPFEHTTVPVPQEGVPVGEQALAADDQITGTPAESEPATAEIIPGPGSQPELQQAGADATVSGSHLDPDV